MYSYIELFDKLSEYNLYTTPNRKHLTKLFKQSSSFLITESEYTLIVTNISNSVVGVFYILPKLPNQLNKFSMKNAPTPT